MKTNNDVCKRSKSHYSGKTKVAGTRMLIFLTLNCFFLGNNRGLNAQNDSYSFHNSTSRQTSNWADGLRTGAKRNMNDCTNEFIMDAVIGVLPEYIGKTKEIFENIVKYPVWYKELNTPAAGPNAVINRLKPIADLGGPGGRLLIPLEKSYWSIVFDGFAKANIHNYSDFKITWKK
jgi:hypothetical protein